MAEENQEAEKQEARAEKGSGSGKMIVSIIIVAAVFFAVGFFASGASITGLAVASPDVGQKAVDFVNEYMLPTGVAASLVNVTAENGMHLVTINIADGEDSNDFPLYVSPDGRYLFIPNPQSPIDMDEPPEIPEPQSEGAQEGASEPPKTDRPEASLFMFSYCPAGTQALSSFVPVGQLLGSKADLKVKFFSDMHGAHELQQNMIQLCIQEKAPEKYWSYASGFIENIFRKCASAADKAECDRTDSIALMEELGINSDEVMACVDGEGAQLYQSNTEEASLFGLQYSPSLVVNGLSLGAGFNRSPDGIKGHVCSAFNTPPAECDQSLGSSQAATTGGGCGA
ncbi:MAG: DsbA family protein [Candidatus Aenigmatarchaeota archaeon]